jgi:hypothetical protein
MPGINVHQYRVLLGLFSSAFLVLVSAAVLVLLAYTIAHLSLKRLENTVRVNLTQLGFLPTDMFKQRE